MRPLHSALVTPAFTGINFYLTVGFTAASAPVPAHARSQRVTTAAGSKGATLAGASTGGDKVAPTGSPFETAAARRRGRAEDAPCGRADWFAF
jgi:hypothetical protein